MDYTKQNDKIIDKLTKMMDFEEVVPVFYPTETFPVNLYFKTKDGLRFYIANSKYDGWQVDYTRDSNIENRSDMYTIRGFKNQTETLKFVEGLITGKDQTVKADGAVLWA